MNRKIQSRHNCVFILNNYNKFYNNYNEAYLISYRQMELDFFATVNVFVGIM